MDVPKGLQGGSPGAGARRPRPGLVIDAVLPPIDGHSPPPSGGAYLALLVALFLEASIPSLLCYWGILLVFWADPPVPSLAAIRATGMLWTPVLFSASWSVAEPWSETLVTVHGHPRLCSAVGAVLLPGGHLLAALGAVFVPSSPLQPLLSGVSAGITSGIGASLLSRSARLVLGQRWGHRTALALSLRRFARAMGLTMAPLMAISLGQRLGPGGTLLVAAGVCLNAVLAPLVFKLPRHQQPRKYDKLQEAGGHPGPAQHDVEVDDVQTETSDDGGSASGPPTPSPQSQAGQTTVVAEVHCDKAGEKQSTAPPPAPAPLTLRPDATARLNGGPCHPQPQDAPRPLFGEEGQWNIAYSFDCDGDDDIELFVRRLSPKRGPLARFCSGVGSFLRGCRADLRPLLRPSFYLSLYTLTCCRLAAVLLPVLLPALTVVQLGARSRMHIMAALPAVAGVGGMLFGLAVHWEAAGDKPRSWRRLLGVVSAISAVGFFLLSWGRSQWWLMLGCLAAGYGTAGATWAQHFATKDAMGGATTYRAQPLLSVLTGILTVLAPIVCDVEIASCFAILAFMYTALSALWVIQPYVSRFC